METLPEEILGEIFDRLPRSSLLAVSQVSTEFKRVALKKVIYPKDGKTIRKLCSESDFFSLTYYYKECPQYLLEHFSQLGNTKMVSKLYGVPTDQYGPGIDRDRRSRFPVDDILEGACKGGHLELAKWAVSWGAKLDYWPSHYAGKGGHKNIIEWLCNSGRYYECYILDPIYERRDMELLKWVAQRITVSELSTWAYEENNQEIIQWLLQEELIDPDEALNIATLRDNQVLVRFIRQNYF